MKNLDQIPQNPLAGLKDIHLPPQPDWWPPAPGWWLVAALIIAVLSFTFYRWQQRQKRLRPIKLALKELKTLDFKVTETVQRQLLLQQVSALLRRFSLAFFGQNEIAELCGEPWLDFLCEKSGRVDRVAERKTFSQLLSGAYAPNCDIDLVALEESVTDWLKNLRRQKFVPASTSGKNRAKLKGTNK